MSYKARFSPHEVLVDGTGTTSTPISQGKITPGLHRKRRHEKKPDQTFPPRLP
jgi:hypothetical protein